MQHARGTLRKIFSDTVCKPAGEEAPLLAWPVVCGAIVAERTRALSFVELMVQQYLAGLKQVSGQQVQNISFVVAPHAPRPIV
jgi:hypothetical protein